MMPPSRGGSGRIGRYRLVRRMAAGGMSDLYLGQVDGSAGYQRTVVVKMLRDDLSDDEHLLAQMAQEAKVVACLEHENIVRTLEVGEEEGTHFLAMEFIFGRTLQQIVDRCASLGVSIPSRQVTTIMAELLTALSYAHEEATVDGTPLRIVHRDISPANLIVGFDGITRLLDFGLARSDVQVHRTRAGVVKGRFAYMAPEQFARRKVDRRADLFSAGVILWELLCRRRLFERSNELETIKAVTRDGIPFAKRVEADAPVHLAMVAQRALARSPGWRFSSAKRMRSALLRFETRTTEDMRDDLEGWIRELFLTELRVREAALQRARREPTVFRKVRDSGFELLPEVTDPGLAVPIERALVEPGAIPWWETFTTSRWFEVVGVAAVFFGVGIGLMIGRLQTPSDDVGFVYVISDRPATVWIGGEEVGTAPVQRIPVYVGTHRVEAQFRGSVRKAVIDVRRGQNRLVKLSFDAGEGIQ